MGSGKTAQAVLAANQVLQQMVAQKLQLDWSPEQISGWLQRQFSSEPAMHISHETIYRSLFIQARGVLKKTSKVSVTVSTPNKPH